ncbi:class I SAM-dependent methyltransferase [Mesorhizobium sp. NPDC059025]|uniref:class I SAM-dependent methyltransferase n=1 Tax=unclassified Mesorhizobium TaxID=325217 RepID=UPI003682AC0A
MNVLQSAGATRQSQSSGIFRQVAGHYRYRPRYPHALIAHVSDLSSSLDHSLPAVDVGAGTGLFTFALAQFLVPQRQVVGVEPSSDMRANAVAVFPASGRNVTFVDGSSTHLPFAESSLALVTAACAYHRFSRQKFLNECARVLCPQGLLAIVDYQLASPPGSAGDEIFCLLEKFAPAFVRGHRTNEYGQYERIDISREVRSCRLFSGGHTAYWCNEQEFSENEFIGYVSTLSPTLIGMRRLGRPAVESLLRSIFYSHEIGGRVVMSFDTAGVFCVNGA